MDPRASRPDGIARTGASFGRSESVADPAQGPTTEPDEAALWTEVPVEPVRLGGVTRHEEGCDLVWSIADGRRGRRWREACARLGRVWAARVLESGPEGRFSRLEVASPSGLLTLHPSEDGRTLYGNAVTPSGMRHVALPWGDAHRILVAGSVASVAMACRHLETVIQPGGSTIFRGVGVDAELRAGEGSVRIERTGLTSWRVSVASVGVAVAAEIDERGVPLGGTTWSLEASPGA